jgi:hypothetical protein
LDKGIYKVRVFNRAKSKKDFNIFVYSRMSKLSMFITFCFATLTQLPKIDSINPLIPYGVLPTDNRISATPDLKWSGADFSWPCSTTKALLKSSGKFTPKANIATRAQIFRDTAFFALPRYRKGIPATLVKTKLKKGACSVTFEPFPCWTMQEEGKCSAMQSVVDIVVDGSEIIWVRQANFLQ